MASKPNVQNSPVVVSPAEPAPQVSANVIPVPLVSEGNGPGDSSPVQVVPSNASPEAVEKAVAETLQSAVQPGTYSEAARSVIHGPQGVVDLPIDHIKTNLPTVQIRKRLSSARIKTFEELPPEETPPVKVIYNPDDLGLHGQLVDGHHRVAASKRKKRKTIRAEYVSSSSGDEVYKLALKFNREPGSLPLTSTDQECAARKLAGLGMAPEEIAKVLMTFPGTVSRWLREEPASKPKRNTKVYSVPAEKREGLVQKVEKMLTQLRKPETDFYADLKAGYDSVAKEIRQLNQPPKTGRKGKKS